MNNRNQAIDDEDDFLAEDDQWDETLDDEGRTTPWYVLGFDAPLPEEVWSWVQTETAVDHVPVWLWTGPIDADAMKLWVAMRTRLPEDMGMICALPATESLASWIKKLDQLGAWDAIDGCWIPQKLWQESDQNVTMQAFEERGAAWFLEGDASLDTALDAVERGATVLWWNHSNDPSVLERAILWAEDAVMPSVLWFDGDLPEQLPEVDFIAASWRRWWDSSHALALRS
jgi:hypothetical protein